jgi:hypothetical protein
MFRDIELVSYPVEAVLDDFLLKGELQPRGGLIAYFNDRQWTNIVMQATTIFPLAADRRLASIEPAETIVPKAAVQIVSILNPEQVAAVTLPPTYRKVIFFLAHFAVQGSLHVSTDAHDHDIFDVSRDFFAVSSAAVFPLHALATTPTRDVPLLMLARQSVQAYRVTGGHQPA